MFSILKIYTKIKGIGFFVAVCVRVCVCVHVCRWLLISSPEPKADMSFSDRNFSIVCCCHYHCKLFTLNHWVKGNQVCTNKQPLSFPRGGTSNAK